MNNSLKLRKNSLFSKNARTNKRTVAKWGANSLQGSRVAVIEGDSLVLASAHKEISLWKYGTTNIWRFQYNLNKMLFNFILF
jgi:hypothetical protein